MIQLVSVAVQWDQVMLQMWLGFNPKNFHKPRLWTEKGKKKSKNKKNMKVGSFHRGSVFNESDQYP